MSSPVTGDGEWEDGQDGRQMQGRGIELLTMRGGEIAKWEATFNVWQKGSAPSLPIVCSRWLNAGAPVWIKPRTIM